MQGYVFQLGQSPQSPNKSINILQWSLAKQNTSAADRTQTERKA